jgi:cell division protein FtsQ
MAAQRRNGRKKKRRSALYAPLSFVIICAAIVFSMSIFFRVSTIEVVGKTTYSSEEIIEASGIEKGANLFFINRFSSVSRIFSRLPYIESAGIVRQLPDRVIIEVKQSQALAYVTVEQDCWLIDRNCKLLDKVSADVAAASIKVDGLTPIAPAVGAVLAPGEEESAKVGFLSALLSGLQDRDMIKDVTEIDMSNVTNPSFRYQNRFTVKAGGFEKVEYKLDLLLSTVAQLTPDDSGTLDISADKKVSFSPD